VADTLSTIFFLLLHKYCYSDKLHTKKKKLVFYYYINTVTVINYTQRKNSLFLKKKKKVFTAFKTKS